MIRVPARAVLALAGCLLAATSCDQPTDDAQTPDPPSTSSPDGGGQILDLLDQADVVDDRPVVPGYDRDDFDWTDDHPGPGGDNGCDTRDDVLAAQLDDVTRDPDDNCDVVSGTLADPYTGETIPFDADQPDEVQIDHVVPLAYAWDMGGSDWSADERLAFGNDQAIELLAVDGPANLDKSDAGPADWMPPNEEFHCEYALAFLIVATQYELSITTDDAQVLRDAASAC